MANLGDLLDRQLPCPDIDECFAAKNTAITNPTATIEEPTCDDWSNGLGCETVNFIGKMNWLWNAITCAHDALETRVGIIDGTLRLVDIIFDLDANTVTEVYSDASTQVTSLEKYAENLVHIPESSLSPAIPGRPTYTELENYILVNSLESSTVYYTGDDIPNPENAKKVLEVDQAGEVVEITQDDTVVHASATDVAAVDTANPTYIEIVAHVAANNLREVTLYYTGNDVADPDTRTYVWAVGSMGNVVNIELPRALLPVAQILVPDSFNQRAVKVWLHGESHPDCKAPGITSSLLEIYNSLNALVHQTITPSPVFPLEIVADLGLTAHGPYRAEHTVTDSCGIGGDGGTARPALTTFEGLLPATCIDIVDTSGANRLFADFDGINDIYITTGVGGVNQSGPFKTMAELSNQLTIDHGGVNTVVSEGFPGAKAIACYDAREFLIVPQNPIPTRIQKNEAFSFTGAAQTAVAPSWPSSVYIEAWGAGGAGGAINALTGTEDGAAGGHVRAELPFEGDLIVWCGGGGEHAQSGTRLETFGGGGQGGAGAPANGDNGGASGGGLSGVFYLAETQVGARIIAAGGGGAPTGSIEVSPVVDTAGNGGASTGENAFTSHAGSIGGTGGSQVMGGSGAGGATDGIALRGGFGEEGPPAGGNASGGGGGSGYWGGGGGAGDADPTGISPNNRDTAGGGGSNFVHPSALIVIPIVNNQGLDLQAPNFNRAAYVAPAGDGGAKGEDGQNGIVNVLWIE